MDVFLTGQNRYAISWTHEEVGANPALYVSHHIADHYRKIVDIDNFNQYIYVPQNNDGEEIKKSTRRNWYFKIKYDGGEQGPVYVAGVGGRSAQQVSRTAWRHLKRDIGEIVYLVPRASEGERCDVCWDDVRKTRVRTNCSECEGTGFKSGPLNPIKMYAAFNDEPPQMERMPTKKFVYGQFMFWTSNEPIVHQGDHVLRPRDMEVFEVVKARPSLHTEIVIRQNLVGRVKEKSNHIIDHVTNADHISDTYTEEWSFLGESMNPFR